MNTDKLFTRSVTALPEEVRRRLDGGAPIDWAALENSGTGIKISDAVRAQGRLPESVETLMHRLVADVGIVPADLAAGALLRRAAGAWDQAVTVEADGESYRIRSHTSGEFLTGIRTEAVAGYVILALELAMAVHEADERWIEAGEKHEAAAGDATNLLALCAIWMCKHLRSDAKGDQARRTTAGMAMALDDAWNGQSLKTRAALSAVRLRPGRGAHAPRRSYYAPFTGFRLHSFDPGEIRWLLALAEHAAATVATAGQAKDPPRRNTSPPPPTPPSPTPMQMQMPTPAAEKEADTSAMDSTDTDALEARIKAASRETGALEFGSHPDALMLDRELDELVRIANGLTESVRRRLRDTYGVGFTQALARIRNHQDPHAIISEIKTEISENRAPRWLEELAATLLMDTGALARNGMRTTGIRFQASDEPDKAYRAVEVETGASGLLTPIGLVEQVRLGLAFALDTWRGYTAFRSAGKEGGWILDKGRAEGSDFSPEEQATLEAARRVEQMLDRIQRASGKLALTAFEEAALTVNAFRGVGATTRIAAGWPDTDEAPNPQNPDHVFRIASVAEALHDDIRSIANKYIASWIADAKAYREGGNEAAPPQGEEEPAANGEVTGQSQHTAPKRTMHNFDNAREWRQP